MPAKNLNLQVKKLNPKAKLPTKAHKTDAGWDLYALHRTSINSQSEKVISTGLAMAIPTGYFGLIKVRSSTGINTHVTESAGVIDSGYRNEVGIVLVNYTYAPKTIEAGEKIAQLLILPVPGVKITEVKTLDTTERDGGFGSTGNK